MSALSPIQYQVSPLKSGINRELRRIHPTHQRRIRDVIAALAANPRPTGALQIHPDIYRIRVGRYRVIYHVDDVNRVVTIGRVDSRGEATYRGTRDLF